MIRELDKILGISDPELKRSLTPLEFGQAVLNIVKDGDIMSEHVSTDQLMEAQLNALGFEKGIEIIRESDRWYE